MNNDISNLELFIGSVKNELLKAKIDLKEITSFRATTDMNSNTGLLLIDFKWKSVAEPEKTIEEAEVVSAEGATTSCDINIDDKQDDKDEFADTLISLLEKLKVSDKHSDKHDILDDIRDKLNGWHHGIDE